MIILPAIDLLDGQVVRLRQGKIDQRTVYPEDALYYASRWEEEGGNCLHVVDLNAAFTGEHRNLKLIEKLVSSLNIPVQVGGGVRSLAAAQKFLGAGAARVVVGTRAVQDRTFLDDLVRQFGGDKVAVSVDTKGGKVAVKGWAEISELNALEFIRQIDRAGIGSVIFTDIATDGMLSGPNFTALEKVLAITRCEVISSGGVATIEHIRQLAAIPGLHGAIVGKALFDGTVDLAEAVAVANAGSDAKGAV
ncbi:MAG TPA: 1-(5-phosphoribosyl)-5-[(5-phosphoribosylamino)methylideneamino]imidazole-4-carboxamide isomerase [Chthoniobacterales bacterium]|nr:1-(5-phosphoribosyl)-5-[(5-phosphoribosylamino)methylideneamino]imidazole-4-carboxamide isomerase [Chthoniobacterales bacterium]